MQDVTAPQGRQSPQHYGYVDASARYDCGQCVAKYAEVRGFPELPLRYLDAWHLFLTLYDQQRVGMEAIGLDYAVIPIALEMHGIPRREWGALFDELIVLNHAMQAYHGQQREQREREAKLKGGRR